MHKLIFYPNKLLKFTKLQLSDYDLFKIYCILRAQPISDGYNPVCGLCSKESTAVVYVLKKEGYLNKRNKFISLQHRKKLLLKCNKF